MKENNRELRSELLAPLENISSDYHSTTIKTDMEDQAKTNYYFSMTEASFCHYLDYAFRIKRNKIYGSSKKDINILLQYDFELQTTLDINLEQLFNYINKSKKMKEENELINLIKNIQIKMKKRFELKRNIRKTLDNSIKSNDILSRSQKKFEENSAKYSQKENVIINKIDDLETYLRVMKKDFTSLQKYINKQREKNESKKKVKDLTKNNNKSQINYNPKDILSYINENTQYQLCILKLNNEISLIKRDLIGIRIDNKLFHEEKKLYKDIKKNKELIKAVQFFRRTNHELFIRIKILRNSYEKLSKILNFLSLKEITNFNTFKINNDVSNYEIEFSRLDKINADDTSFDFKMNNKLSFSDLFSV